MGVHSVPAELSLAEQILFVQNRTATTPSHSRASNPPSPSVPPSAASEKDAECKGLNAQVLVLDAYARQPLSGAEQDRVSREKKDVRDRQFRLRCGR